jgi:hypothetical protein
MSSNRGNKNIYLKKHLFILKNCAKCLECKVFIEKLCEENSIGDLC